MSISIFRYCALIICLGTAALAQYVSAQSAQPLNDDERDRVLTEMRAYKHDILSKALNLSKEQQREFFPIYDAALLFRNMPMRNSNHLYWKV